MDKDIRLHNTFYGTAWKGPHTDRHVVQALRKGFRGIDTATQPKHYWQIGVGDGVQMAIKNGIIKSRDDVWLQTKYTSISGQDPANVPYDPKDPYSKQVSDSFQCALKQLQTDYVDSLVLHGPLPTYKETLEVWGEMERLVDQQQVQLLGMSNCYDVEYFQKFYKDVRIKPSILQNRFYQETSWDVDLRHFCRQNDILYQSFWTLTANPALLRHQVVKNFAKKYQSTPESILYRYIIERGGMPLNGTTNPQHMVEDLENIKKPMDPEDVAVINDLLDDNTPL